ncbi:MAG: nuclear transport factor 2 family protein [Actinobacteria bacterium]|nr:nuclear transport factor 2 family protein [Actinomycetota bacterium]
MSAVQDPQADGQALYLEFIGAVAAKDWAAVDGILAADFQSVHTDGPRDKAKELEMLKAEDLGEYSLTDFTTTRAGDTLVATHWLSVAETINGSRLSTKPAPRLTVWRSGPDGWKIIAIANLNPA